MAKAGKVKIPKTVAGFKVPKQIRKSSVVRSLLSSKTGREIAGRALIAGAGAAAAALVAERSDIADASKAAGRKGKRSLARVGEAAESGVGAAYDVVAEAARSFLPSRDDPGPSRSTKQEVGTTALKSDASGSRKHGSASSRIARAVALRGLSVLLRRHPRAALDVAAASAVRAGQVGLHVLAERIQPVATPQPAPSLTRREAKRLLRSLGWRQDQPK